MGEGWKPRLRISLSVSGNPALFSVYKHAWHAVAGGTALSGGLSPRPCASVRWVSAPAGEQCRRWKDPGRAGTGEADGWLPVSSALSKKPSPGAQESSVPRGAVAEELRNHRRKTLPHFSLNSFHCLSGVSRGTAKGYHAESTFLFLPISPHFSCELVHGLQRSYFHTRISAERLSFWASERMTLNKIRTDIEEYPGPANENFTI